MTSGGFANIVIASVFIGSVCSGMFLKVLLSYSEPPSLRLVDLNVR